MILKVYLFYLSMSSIFQNSNLKPRDEKMRRYHSTTKMVNIKYFGVNLPLNEQTYPHSVFSLKRSLSVPEFLVLMVDWNDRSKEVPLIMLPQRMEIDVPYRKVKRFASLPFTLRKKNNWFLTCFSVPSVWH